MNVDELSGAITPEIYEKFREAVALGKWANGQSLTDKQKETCLQAIIAYEHKNLPKEEHTGYVPPKKTSCGHDQVDSETPVKWR